jgi:hypothetical protein
MEKASDENTEDRLVSYLDFITDKVEYTEGNEGYSFYVKKDVKNDHGDLFTLSIVRSYTVVEEAHYNKKGEYLGEKDNYYMTYYFAIYNVNYDNVAKTLDPSGEHKLLYTELPVFEVVINNQNEGIEDEKLKNNNKANKLRLRRKKNYWFRKPRAFNRVSRSNYLFPISLDPIVWDRNNYDSQNLNINVTDTLSTNKQFQTLFSMYQYYKINRVSVKAIPQPYEGIYPPTGWAYLKGNENKTINYQAIPRLPGSKCFPSNKTVTHYFKRIGRQTDFGWYSDQIEDTTFSIRVRFTEQPNDGKFIFQVKVYVVFSMLTESSPTKEEKQEENLLYKNKKNDQQKDGSDQQSRSNNCSKSESFIENCFKKNEEKQKMGVYFGLTQEQILKNEEVNFRFKIENENEFLNKDNICRKEVKNKIKNKYIKVLIDELKNIKTTWDSVNEHYKKFIN